MIGLKTLLLMFVGTRYWARRQVSRGELWTLGVRDPKERRRMKRTGRRQRRAYQAVKRWCRARLPRC
jgi:hypothetical protein